MVEYELFFSSVLKISKNEALKIILHLSIFQFQFFSLRRWAEVEEEERSVGVANRTEVRKFAGKLNEIILEYVRTLREFQDYQLKVIG